MSDRPANPIRGEATIQVGTESYILRPSFQALVAAEEELGSLFDLVERAASGKLLLSEVIALFWHCLRDRPQNIDRIKFADDVSGQGLVAMTPALKILLKQILQGGPGQPEVNS